MLHFTLSFLTFIAGTGQHLLCWLACQAAVFCSVYAVGAWYAVLLLTNAVRGVFRAPGVIWEYGSVGVPLG